MELNRNQFFMLGLVILFLGVQLRFVESFVLNAPATKFLAERFSPKEKQAAAATLLPTLEMTGAKGSGALRTVKPPEWLGWALISIGSVLILHSLAMKKPGA
ncbi:MAG: hypothetical protein WD176_09635 [Pirellulales bacterium]